MDYKVFFSTDNKSGWKCVSSKLQRNNPEIYDLVIHYNNGELNDLPFNRKVWHFINNTKSIPKCLECGNSVKYKNLTLGYQEYCGVKCSNKNLSKIDTTKSNLFEKYGVDTTFKIEAVKEKTRESNIEKFGVDNPFKNKEIQDKIKSNNIVKYGFNTPAKNEEIQHKIKSTNLERYGVTSFLKLEKVKEKIKKTNLERYNIENPINSEEHKDKFNDKRKKTCLVKFGTELYITSDIAKETLKKYNLEHYNSEYSFGSSIFKSKFLEKTSKIEKEVCGLINGEPKFIFNNREYDIKCGYNIFEVDGDYFHVKTLHDLSLIQISTSINDNFKIISMDNSEFNLYKVSVSDINKLSEITIDSLKNISYRPDYTITYQQKIITKEYFTKFLEKKGQLKLMKYVGLLLKFIRTFQPEFPYPDKNYDLNHIKTLISNFDSSKFHNKTTNEFNNNTNTIGCSYLKSIFKSYWNSSYLNGSSPIDIWNDDEKMLKVIAYRIGVNNSNEVFDFSLRNLINGISAIRGTISFFKPIVAAGIYKHYLGDIKEPKVFDPCCGFGGRLLGFKSVYPNGSYTGCEPNINTYNELNELGSNFTSINLNNLKLEEYSSDMTYDLCFTSIPYYDLEDYKNGVDYESFEDWEEKFIKPLLTYKNLVINMPYELCVKLNLEKYIDGYLVNKSTHLNKNKDKKKEVLIKLNF